MNILLAIPVMNEDNVQQKTKDSIEKLLLHCAGKADILPVFAPGTAISAQRNGAATMQTSMAVDQSKKNYPFEWDYYLAVDSDIEFEPESLEALLAMDKDVAGCAYEARLDTSKWTAGSSNNGTWKISPEQFIGKNFSGARMVDWIGMGFTLIKRDAMRKMPYPWWQEALVYFDGHDLEGRKERLCAYAGDDIGFCMNAKKAGFDIWLNAEKPVIHNHGLSTPDCAKIQPKTEDNEL